jgi:hypothetical protein
MPVHPPGIHAHWRAKKGSLKLNGARESAEGNESDQRRVLIFQRGTYLVETKMSDREVTSLHYKVFEIASKALSVEKQCEESGASCWKDGAMTMQEKGTKKVGESF